MAAVRAIWSFRDAQRDDRSAPTVTVNLLAWVLRRQVCRFANSSRGQPFKRNGNSEPRISFLSSSNIDTPLIRDAIGGANPAILRHHEGKTGKQNDTNDRHEIISPGPLIGRDVALGVLRFEQHNWRARPSASRPSA